MKTVLRNQLLSQFICTADKCEDTCCKHWSMQVDEHTLSRYRNESPDMLEAVEHDDAGGMVMRKSPQTGFCVKYADGLCGVHKNLGSAFLGDACFLYPRATRSLGRHQLMTATLSCPEIARLTLQESVAWDYEAAEVERVPDQVKDYLPEGISEDDALAVHRAFLEATHDDSVSVERIFARIASVSRSFELLNTDKWPQAASFYLRMADGRLPAPENNPADPFNLLHAFCGLIVASGKPRSERLNILLDDMTRSLCVSIDWQTVQMTLSDDSVSAADNLAQYWREELADIYAPLLRRWLKMQLALSLFPFAGLGESLSERISIIGVRLATLKLAILCSCAIQGETLPVDGAVRVAQTIARVLDHLGSSRFSLDIYAEPKWLEEARMLGLLNF